MATSGLGHAAMEIFLMLNGYEIKASVDEQEQLVLDIASGTADRTQLNSWLAAHVVKTR
jgi:death on curing protein